MTAAPTHHPDGELLLAHTAGELDPAVALAISAHLDLCPRCARRATALAAVGGVILEQMPPAELSPSVLRKTLESLDRPDTRSAEPECAADDKLHSLGFDKVPRSLRSLTAAAAKTRGWNKYPGGIREFVLHKEPQEPEVRFLLIPPRTGVPRHTHGGLEVTLVISGAFRDETGFYGPGDLAICTEDLTHRPIAGAEVPCLALVVTCAPLRFTGVSGLIQRAFGAA